MSRGVSEKLPAKLPMVPLIYCRKLSKALDGTRPTGWASVVRINP